MKTLILITSALFGLAANASSYPDELYPVFNCNSIIEQSDSGTTVEVLEGGIAGVPQIRVTRYNVGHASTDTYFAHRLKQNPKRIGSPIVYEGRDVRLAMNFTSAPLEDGGHYSTLEVRHEDMVAIEELSCKIVRSK